VNAKGFETLALAGFEAVPALKGGVLELELRGNADMTVSAMLGSYLKELDERSQKMGVPLVRVKLLDLYFLNSSCFQAIAGWLLAIAARPPDGRYGVEFETNAAQSWQRRSLEAIRRIAPGVAVVT
jgi:hypothetical protein